MKKARAGSRLHNGVEVPINAKIYKDNEGRGFRLHSINDNVTFIYLDNEQKKTAELKKGLNFLNKIIK